MKEAADRSSTQERLLEAAQKLMLAKGFTATSVDEICAAARLTKGSFFHYFGSKEELGRAVLDHFWASTRRVMQAGPFNKVSDPLGRLYAYLEFFIALSRNPSVKKSCLFGNFSQELSATHPEIRARCAEGFAQWAEALKRDLDEAKKRHAPQARFNSRSLADHFIAVFEGALILAKVRQDTKVIEESIRHFRRYLEALFGNTRPHAMKAGRR